MSDPAEEQLAKGFDDLVNLAVEVTSALEHAVDVTLQTMGVPQKVGDVAYYFALRGLLQALEERLGKARAASAKKLFEGHVGVAWGKGGDA